MTIARRFTTGAMRLLVHMEADLTTGAIDGVVCRRSEFPGGMACTILTISEQQQ